MNTEGVKEYIDNYPSKYKQHDKERRVIFSIPYFVEKEQVDPKDVYIVLWVDKVLQNNGGDVYLKTHTQKILAEKEKVKEAYILLEKFRQPLFWSFEPLFEEKDEKEKKGIYTLREGEFTFNELMFVSGDGKSDKKTK
jgi:hypothetical protein